MIVRHIRFPALLLAFVTLSGCDGGTEPEEPQLTTITVTSADSKTSIMLGETLQLSAAGKDQNGDAIDATFTWSSSNTAVATVNSTSGLVTPVGGGTATITAESGGKQGTFALTVAGSLHSLDITTNQTWRAADNPHLVRADIEVSGSGTPLLTIEPGVEVRFASGTGLTIGSGSSSGALKAAGTATAPIKFVAEGSSPAKGAWEGVIFESTAAPSELRNATLSHCGGSSFYGTACLQAVGSSGTGPKPVVENVKVENSGGYGVLFIHVAAFGTGSANLSVSGSDKLAIVIDANEAGTLPTGGTFSGNTPNGVELRDGHVTRTQTWPNLGMPYVVVVDVDVEGTATPVLTLTAGTELRFASGTLLTIGGGTTSGALKAAGTATAPIKFVADAAAPAKGHWEGVLFESTASLSELRNVTLSHCGGSSFYGSACLQAVGSSGTGPKPVVENVKVENSGGYGVLFIHDAAFGTGSANLSVSGSGNLAIAIDANEAGTLPTGGTFSGNTPNGVELRDGHVTNTQTWPNLGMPYVVVVDLDVEGTATPVLTLTAGTELRFASGTLLTIGGGTNSGVLKVTGTAEQPVKFTANAATPSSGHWDGLTFESAASSQSSIAHAIVEFAGGSSFYGQANVIVLKDIGGFITNSTISNSAGCGILRKWTATASDTDFTATSLGNTFASNTGGNQCGP